MLTFSLNLTDNDLYAQRVMEAINNNIRYFKKFNMHKWEEAVQKTFIAAMENRNDDYDDLEPYIKKLARTILRVKDVESPYDVYNESGEVAFVFTTLTESIPEGDIGASEEIMDTLKELYLYNEEEFMKLKLIFKYDDVQTVPDLKNIVIKDQVLKTEFFKLVRKYDPDIIFRTLYMFFRNLSQYTAPKEHTSVREIVLREGNYSFLSKIPDLPCIKDEDGNLHLIDKVTLTMDVNPDYIKWDTAFNTNCDIIKIDISPLMDYMYTEVFVPQGVNTRHITWCDDKYKLTSPGGYVSVGVDKNKFMSLVRVELILNILMNNINTIIAVSPDSVYIKPTRSMELDKLRLHLTTGKIIDLPVSVHLKKRRLFA